jgi:hypothetical protein
MANVKITDMTAATVPLAGTELFETVQSGATRNVAASAIANTFNGTLSVAHGGTGVGTLTGYVKGSGTSAMTASASVPWTDVSGKPTNYGSFYDTTTQTTGANTATVMLFSNTGLVDGVTLSGGSLIYLPATGVYNIQFSAQLANSAAQDYQTSIWIRKNNVDIANSCTDITVPAKTGSVNGYSVAAWNFMDSFTAGQYFQLIWSTPNTGVYIEALGTRTTPTRPAAPSIILTVNQVA